MGSSTNNTRSEDILALTRQARKAIAQEQILNGFIHPTNEEIQTILSTVLLNHLLAPNKPALSTKEVSEVLSYPFATEEKRIASLALSSQPRTDCSTFDSVQSFIQELGGMKSLRDDTADDVLGRLYEQYLNHIAETSSKPNSLRKSRGIFYTPLFVVEHMVNTVVARLQKQRIPLEDLTFLDPACGSGAFLIEAFKKVLTLYKQNRQGSALSIPERIKVLKHHIFGLDLDMRAVLVARDSLLLIIFRDSSIKEKDQHINQAVKVTEENIRCGNALIDGKRKKPPHAPQEELRILKAFDWAEHFISIQDQKGFRAILGNPPYRRELDYKDILQDIAQFDFGKNYAQARMDLWYYFVHRGLELLHPDGLLSFIVNSYWTSSSGAKKLIQSLQTGAHIKEIFHLGKLRVFEQVSGQHMIMTIASKSSTDAVTIKQLSPNSEQNPKSYFEPGAEIKTYQKEPEDLFRNGKIDLEPISSIAKDLIQRMESQPRLETLGTVRQGIAENPSTINKKTILKHKAQWNAGEGVFSISHEETKNLALSSAEKSFLRPYYELCDIQRYHLASTPSRNIIYTTKHNCPDIDQYPQLRKHLERFRSIMESRRETKKGSNKWWHLHWPREVQLWDEPKILSLQMAKRPSFVPVFKRCYVGFSVNVFRPHDRNVKEFYYISSILNSRLLWKWFSHNCKRRGLGLEINGNTLRRTPIYQVESNDLEKQGYKRQLVQLSQEISELDLSEDDRRKRAQLDAQIDQLIYKIYGLNPDEIEHVEQSYPR